MVPTARQATFLSLDCDEALYGGSAGSAKTEGLLLWLLDGIDYPEYSGIIFRKTLAQAKKSNEGLIAKSYRIYRPLGGVYNRTDNYWTFPSGARIEIGHIQHEQDIFNYQGPAWHRAAFDELTQFSLESYEYILTRLRAKTDCPISPAARSASNPGGQYHRWVKNRFVTKEAIDFLAGLGEDDPTPENLVFWNGPRAFVPARLIDNPHIDRPKYRKQLEATTNPVLRERLLKGDWSISEDAVIRAEWLRWWEQFGESYRLLTAEGAQLSVIHPRECTRFAIVDCAGSSEDVAKERRGKPASFSVITTWDYAHKTGLLILRDMARGRWGFTELCAKIGQQHDLHRPDWIGIENEKTGMAALSILKQLPTRSISHEGKDKLTRAGTALNQLEQGRIFFPAGAPWRPDLEGEFLSWDGSPDAQADIIDTMSYAARHSISHAVGTWEMDVIPLVRRY